MRSGVLILFPIFAVLGCQTGPSIAGTWDMSAPQMQQQGATATATFAQPDRVTMNVVVTGDGQQSALGIGKGATINLKIDGKYKLEGDKLTIDVSTAEATESGLTGFAKQNWSMVKKQTEDQFLAQAQTNKTSTIKWEGNDKFVGDSGQGTVTFTRK
ncbi:MAG: hypothetical protein KIT11_03705 [Fimbriimonadaceae bacterium]|nr:hypothetical protein [Fimbriimonadaceae bacterium]QYK56997.1 MAG: hypothetical protein KF733_05820 [Fimbriimonadaceae bacterium]